MPDADRTDPVRRSLVPPRAAVSVWSAAAWTGAGTAVVGAVAGVAAVAVLWLPAAGEAGNARSALKAGLLTFLAALHGGVTVDGLSADFVPLGLTLAVVALAWRAGVGLADAAADLGERDPRRLAQALGVQTVSFAFVCGIAAHVATLGTSHVPVFGVPMAALVLFGVSAGAGLVRSSPGRHRLAEVLSPAAIRALRAGVAVVAVYLLAGALLAALSLIAHHDRVQTLSAQVGGGASGIPVLLLGALAAPNAVIAGAAYLAGPGFAVGSGNTVSLWSGAHGTVPAFPILGGLPSAPAGAAAWTLASLAALGAGGCAARLVADTDAPWRDKLVGLARAAGVSAAIMLVLSWQGGGAIGSGQLSAVGASPWQAPLALAALTLVGGGLGLLAVASVGLLTEHGPAVAPLRVLATRTQAAAERLDAGHAVIARDDRDEGTLRATLRSVAAAVSVTEQERMERAADEVDSEIDSADDSEITAPIPRIAAGDDAAGDPPVDGAPKDDEHRRQAG